MASSIDAILSAIAPQFDSDPNRDVHIEIAEARTGTCFGDKYNYAVALRAAHTLTLTDRAESVGGGSGSITSKREGDVAIGFGGFSDIGVAGDLGQTSYGVQLADLIKSCIPRVSVTGSTVLTCY